MNLIDLADFIEVEENFELSSKRNSDIAKTDVLQEKVNSIILGIAASPVEEVAMVEPEPEPVVEQPEEEPVTEPEPVEEPEPVIEAEPVSEPEEEHDPEPGIAPDEEETEVIKTDVETEKKEAVSDRSPQEIETTDNVVQPKESSPPDTGEPEELLGEPEPKATEPEDDPNTLRVTEPEPEETEAEAIVEPEPEPEPDPEPAPEPIPAAIKQEYKDVLFGFDQSSVPGNASKDLDKMIAQMKANSTLKAEINGHTDHVGPEEYNKKLSLRRANAVARYLKSKGISAARLVINGYGESRPRAANVHPDGTDNPQGRKKNRRTEIRLVGSSMRGPAPQA